MTEKIKKIFDILNVEPYEEFRLKEAESDYTYRITKDLKFEYRRNNDGWMLQPDYNRIRIIQILTDEQTIIKIPKPTKTEQIAIEYAKACGYNWIARDKNGYLNAFEEKPHRFHDEEWTSYTSHYMRIEIDILFIQWEDEPYYIG